MPQANNLVCEKSDNPFEEGEEQVTWSGNVANQEREQSTDVSKREVMLKDKSEH